MKKVSFRAKPGGSAERLSPDEWVNDKSAGQPMKRLTIDVPLSLHKRIKSQCAADGVNMADAVRELLEKQFAKEYQGDAGGEGSEAQPANPPGNTIL